jgi:serine/threonine protein kinase
MSGTLEKGIVIKDRYRIEKLVGKGGQKRVYLATDLSGKLGDKKLALKEMIHSHSGSNQVASMHLFEQEAIILKDLRHPSIPHVYDYFVDQGTFYMIQEYIDGESLSNLMYKHTFSQGEALEYAIQMADMLQYLHRCKPPIIYRDLKPQNVKIHSGRVYFIDFSGALLPGIGAEAESARIVSKGYTPPDAHKRKKVDFTYDTYALGVVLFEMLTRYDVKSSDGNLPDIRKIRPDISSEIREIVNKAVYRGHYWQYQTMWEMKMELTNALNSIQKLTSLEEKKEKNIFIYPLIWIHRFRISLVQPLLAFFLFIMIAFMLAFPYLMRHLGITSGLAVNYNLFGIFALYLLLVNIIWGRWFGGVSAFSRLYKRFHAPVPWMGKISLISTLLIVNLAIIAVLIILFVKAFITFH